MQAIAAELSERRLKKEHDTTRQHLSNLELAYTDVCRKYKNSKRVIDALQSRATLVPLDRSEIMCATQIPKMSHMEISNQEMQLIQDRYEFEIQKLHTVMKRLTYDKNVSHWMKNQRNVKIAK